MSGTTGTVCFISAVKLPAKGHFRISGWHTYPARGAIGIQAWSWSADCLEKAIEFADEYAGTVIDHTGTEVYKSEITLQDVIRENHTWVPDPKLPFE